MIPIVSTRQMKAARALLGWSQKDLAKGAGISIASVKRIEASTDMISTGVWTVQKIIARLEARGIELTVETDGALGVRLVDDKQ